MALRRLDTHGIGVVGSGVVTVFAFEGEDEGTARDAEVLVLVPVPVVRWDEEVLGGNGR